MINSIMEHLGTMVLAINFVCHLVIFLGGFYVALHSRILPVWTITCLWYIGLSSLFIDVTILLEWTLGSNFPMAYTQLGKFGDTISNIVTAVTVWLMFSHTLIKDIKEKNKRQKVNSDMSF